MAMAVHSDPVPCILDFPISQHSPGIGRLKIHELSSTDIVSVILSYNNGSKSVFASFPKFPLCPSLLNDVTISCHMQPQNWSYIHHSSSFDLWR